MYFLFLIACFLVGLTYRFFGRITQLNVYQESNQEWCFPKEVCLSRLARPCHTSAYHQVNSYRCLINVLLLLGSTPKWRHPRTKYFLYAHFLFDNNIFECNQVLQKCTSYLTFLRNLQIAFYSTLYPLVDHFNIRFYKRVGVKCI